MTLPIAMPDAACAIGIGSTNMNIIYKDNHNEEIIAEQIEIQIEIHFKTDINIIINIYIY